MYGWSPPFTALRNSSMFPCVAQIGFGNCSGKHVVQICSLYRMVQSHRRLQLNSVSTVSFPFLKAPTWPLNLCLVHHIIMYTASEPFVADAAVQIHDNKLGFEWHRCAPADPRSALVGRF